MSTLYESTLRSLPLLGRGKVRDNYAVGNDQLLIVTTDRLSAFDVIMGEPIPNKGRALVVKRLEPILVEAVVRGYLAGSGWKDYQATGSVCGVQLPAGLQNAQKMPEPIFTPAAKAE